MTAHQPTGIDKIGLRLKYQPSDATCMYGHDLSVWLTVDRMCRLCRNEYMRLYFDEKRAARRVYNRDWMAKKRAQQRGWE